MKKRTNFKKIASFTLAAMMALTVYMPTAAFASTEEADNTAADPQAAPVAEQQESSPAPAVTEQKAPAAEQKAPAVADQAATEQPAVEQKAPETSEQNVQTEGDAEAQEPAAVESQYGTATENWGYGNDSKTTTWKEYTKDGETILVFSSTGDSDLDEDNAVTQILDQDGKSVKDQFKNKVTQVIFETGITGIGWTALYSNSGYEPLYGSDEYTVDKTKTDLFKDFTKLTTVVPCETIKRIGWSAFRKCYNLSNFDFTKCPQLEVIMNQAFNECKSLNNVDLSECNLLETIAWSAFNGAGKGSDANLALPKSGVLSIIGGYAFYQYANKNSNGTEVDFSGVANSVTQILQNAFNGANVVGEITGFKSLETFGKDAIKNSGITYTPYVAPVEEEPAAEEPKAEEPAVEEPVAEEPAAVEEPVAEEPAAEEPAVEEPATEEPAAEEPVADESAVEEPEVEAASEAAVEAIAVAEAVVETAAEVVAPAVNADEVLASSVIPMTTATAGKSAGTDAVNSASLTHIEDSADPAAAPASDTVNISETSVPMADSQSGSSLGFILGGLAAALLLALAAMHGVERRRAGSNL